MHVAAIRRDGLRLAAAAGGALQRPVGPQCPGWTVADLVFHVGRAHAFWREVVEGSLQDPSGVTPPPRPPDGALVAWYAAGVERLVSALEAADPRASVWTWSRRRDVAFVARRMAHETAVHAWDVAHGDVDAELASDGVEEFLEHFLSGRGADSSEPGERVLLVPDDVVLSWHVRTGGPVVVSEHGDADCEVHAPASDLLLLLWRRIPPGVCRVDGAPRLLARFLGRANLE